METSFGGSSELLHDPVIPLLGLCPREMNIGVQKKKKKTKLTHIHSSSILNGQTEETIQISNN